MNFALSDEQEELRRTVRDFLDKKSPEGEVRRLMDTTDGYDPAVWAQMGEQLGLQGLAIPEALGGSGYGFVELAVVLEEMGRRLLCAPYFSTVVLAASALLLSGDDAAQKEHLPGIATGATVATLACTEEGGRWDEAGVNATATPVDGGWVVSGVKTHVLDGHVADLLLVSARTAAGVSLFAVRGDAAGLTRTPLTTLDQTRKQARIELVDTPAALVGVDGGGWAVVEQVVERAAVGLAAEQVGGAQRAMEMAVDYAKERVQFGRPIGSFQAIKHKCANLLVEVESARSAAMYASWCAAEGNAELTRAAAMAKSYCSEAYSHAAGENIQIHGGIGFTWEHPAHLYFKRATTSEVLFGGPAHWREVFAAQSGF
jgi:alkylation response protein AidB-like acyl-CoA dehydrogenase